MARPRREPPATEAELIRQIILQLQEQMQQLTMVVQTLAEPHLFIEEEESHFIYREIYGDPIYDIYDDEFENLTRAKFGRDQNGAKFGQNSEVLEDPVCEDFSEDLIRAKVVQSETYADFGYRTIRANFGYSQIRVETVQIPSFTDSVRADFVQIQYHGFKKICLMLKLLKIRGRIFLYRGRPDAAKIQDSRTNLSWPARPDAAPSPQV